MVAISTSYIEDAKHLIVSFGFTFSFERKGKLGGAASVEDDYGAVGVSACR